MPEDAEPADEEEQHDEVDEDDDDGDDDGEETAAFKEAHKQWKAEMKPLTEQCKADKRAQVAFGGMEGSESTVAAIHNAIQIVTLAEDEVPFVERLMNQFARIGDDVDHEGQLDEMLTEIENENAPEPAGGGFSMMNTRHSYIFQAAFEHSIDLASKAARQKKWPEVYRRLVAILLAVTRFDHWLEDTEDPDENNKVLKKLGAQWEKLLATHESGEWPALERDFEACKKSLQIVNDKVHAHDNCDYAAYKLPVKGVVRQKRTRS